MGGRNEGARRGVIAGPACVIVASGPSAGAAADRLASVPGSALIVVNDSWRLAPHAGVLYACDPEWIRHHAAAVAEGFKGERVTQSAIAAAKHGWGRVVGRQLPGLSTKPGEIHFNDNSGAQAINLAVGRGFRCLVLVGFDMGHLGKREHWFGDHPNPLRNGSPYHKFVANMGRVGADLHALGVQAINTSPVNRLRMFPRMDLEDALRAAGL